MILITSLILKTNILETHVLQFFMQIKNLKHLKKFSIIQRFSEVGFLIILKRYIFAQLMAYILFLGMQLFVS